jgi:hypothetical protein
VLCDFIKIYWLQEFNFMSGLFFLGFFAVYFLISFLIIKGTLGWAKKSGRNQWAWGFLASFLMYNLVFWDWIPTIALHHQYCEFDGGTTVYKTPADWALENPDLVGNLPAWKSDSSNRTEINGAPYIVNDRNELRFFNQDRWPAIRRMETTLFDRKTKMPLLKQVQYGSRCYQTDGIDQYKLWMPPCGCGTMEKRPQDFNLFMNKYMKIWVGK